MNSAWLAMSARYSNTSSRGREIVVETVIGSTVGDAHRVAECRAVDDARVHRLVALQRAAKLAQHDLALVEVDLLPDQRRPVASPAALEIRHAIVNSTTQKGQLEVSNHPHC